LASIINASNSGFGGIVSTGDSSGELQLQTAGTTAVTIDTSQNVGIGTSSPSALLDVNGNVAITGSARRITGDFSNGTVANRVAFQTSTTNGNTAINAIPNGTSTTSSFQAFNTNDPANASATQVLVSSTESSFRNAINGTGTYLPMTFYTNGSERMRIDTSGNVQIGKTSNSTLSAGINLGSLPNFIASTASPSDGPYMQISNIAASVANGFRYISFRVGSSGNEAGSISTNGSSTVSYVTSSDYRLKENVKPMVGALDVISKLNPVTYTWKIDGSDGQGFIAHELQEVVPDAVTGKKDAVDEEGNIKPQGVDTSFLVATLTAAIQEQQTIINDLKARIEILEAK